MNDVDLLVRPHQARAAHAILLDLGYRPHHPALAGDNNGFNAETQRRRGAENNKKSGFFSATPRLCASALQPFRRLDAYFSAAGDLNYIHRDRPWAWIDLHWDPARCDRFRGSIRMRADAMVDEAVSVPFNPKSEIQNPKSPSVLLLHPDHELLYLAAHHAIFNRGVPSHTLEDIRRLLKYFGFWNLDFGLNGAGNERLNPKSQIQNRKSLVVLARKWGLRRALQKTLRDLSSPPCPPSPVPRPPSRSFGIRPFFQPLLDLCVEPALLDTWPDRARWLRRLLFPSPAWRAFAYGDGRAGPARHWQELAAKLVNA